MPRYDGTGPMGFGPMTGRGFGPCGRGMGFGRGRRFAEPTKDEEKAYLEAELKAIKKRLEELKK